MVKIHWFEMLCMGLLLLAAFTPILINTLLPDFYSMRLSAELGQDAGIEQQQSAQLAVAAFRSTTALIQIPLYAVFAVILAGAVRIIRQYAYEEIVFFRRDWLIGIKQNRKHYLLIALFIGVQGFIGIWLSGSGKLTLGYAVGTLSAVYNLLGLLVFLPVLAYMLVLTAVYSNTLWQNLKLGFALYAKSIPATLGTLLFAGLCYAVSLIPNFFCHLIGRALGTLLLPASFLIWTLFTLTKLDKYINPQFYPEQVGKGLFKPGQKTSDTNTSEGESAPCADVNDHG